MLNGFYHYASQRHCCAAASYAIDYAMSHYAEAIIGWLPLLCHGLAELR